MIGRRRWVAGLRRPQPAQPRPVEHTGMLLVLLACLPYAMPRLPEDELRRLGHPAGRLGITRRNTPKHRAAGARIPRPRQPLVTRELFDWAILDQHTPRQRRRPGQP